MINKIHQLEKAMVLLLNFDGWELKWSGEGMERYDAKGKTPKGFDCVIEMKFRKTYYETKMLEKDKYDALMKLNKDVIKIYFVNDPKGNYMYYLNTLEMPKTEKKYCPDTTMWTKKRLLKDVYLLKENDAVRINLNEQLLIILFISYLIVYLIIINLKQNKMLHTKTLNNLIDVFSKKEKLHKSNNKHVLNQLEILQLEIERDIIQTKYDTIDKCYEIINKK